MKPPVYKRVREDERIRPVFHNRFREILLEQEDGETNKSVLKEELGYSSQRINTYLDREKPAEPSFVSVAAIANVLNVSLDYLAGNSDDKVDDPIHIDEAEPAESAAVKKSDAETFELKNVLIQYELADFFENIKGLWRKENLETCRIHKRFIIEAGREYRKRYPDAPLPGIHEYTGPDLTAMSLLNFTLGNKLELERLIKSILSFTVSCCMESYFKNYLSEEDSALEQNQELLDKHIPSLAGDDFQAKMLELDLKARRQGVHELLDKLLDHFSETVISQNEDTLRSEAELSISSVIALLNNETIIQSEDAHLDLCSDNKLVDSGDTALSDDNMYKSYLKNKLIPETEG